MPPLEPVIGLAEGETRWRDTRYQFETSACKTWTYSERWIVSTR
jgi:hypothetical protein